MFLENNGMISIHGFWNKSMVAWSKYYQNWKQIGEAKKIKTIPNL